MGEGQDKIARSLLDLEPTAILDLFLVYPDYNGQPDEVFAIHNGSLFKKGVVWQGRTYIPIGLEIDGFEVNADGRINRPKIKVSNKDYFVTSLLKKFNNFQSARVVQKRTFIKYLDDENFDGGNPFGQSDFTAELSSQQYIVAQKTQENKIFVEFELTSPLDLDNFQLNHRRIMGKYCYWKYRGIGCRYAGPPIQKENGGNFKDIDGNSIAIDQNKIDSFEYGDVNSEYSKDKQYEAGDVVYITAQNKSQSEVYNYYVAKTQVQGLKPNENPKYWDKDGCSKKLSSCKVHFPETGTLNRFIGLGDAEIDSAVLGDEITSPAFELITESYDGTLYGSPLIAKLKISNNWTLAFNLKNIQDINAKNGIFQTRFGDGSQNDGQVLQLFIENNRFIFQAFETNASIRSLETPIRSELSDPKGLSNYPIIVGEKNSNTIFIYEPSFGNYLEFNASTGIDKTLVNNFVVGFLSNFNQAPGIPPSTKMTIDSICFWTKALTRAEMDQLYRKPIDGGLRAKKYSNIQAEIAEGSTTATLLEQVENWWEGAFTGDAELSPSITTWTSNQFDGIRDLKQQDDLYLRKIGTATDPPLTGSFAIDADTYQYNIEETITVGQAGVYLPFGGFPGTDGFDFTRNA